MAQASTHTKYRLLVIHEMRFIHVFFLVGVYHYIEMLSLYHQDPRFDYH